MQIEKNDLKNQVNRGALKDINGRTHSSSEIEGVNEDVILNLPGGKGVYLIELQSSDSTLYSKVIKL